MDSLMELAVTEGNKLLRNVSTLSDCVTQGQGLYDRCFLTSDALTCSFFLLACTCVYCFIWSIVCNNVSKVDQIWSIIPVCYSWVFLLHYYFTNGSVHYRLLIVTVLMTIWGVRLTYNFARRGGYGNFFQHEEDYRWPILRKMMNLPTWLLFNLTFIASYQNLLLWLIALPAYVVYQGSPEWIDLGLTDIILGHTFFFLLVLETVADQQHYDFQEYKYSLTPAERLASPQKSVREGFFQVKLWRFCRHPNYLAEQGIWLCVYLFSCISSGCFFNWSVAGIVLLVLLFQGSMMFSESITLAKYPLYANYQAAVPKMIPRCCCSCCGDAGDKEE